MQQIDIEQIRPNPGQPRKSFQGIEELAESIKEQGLLEPLVVRPKAGTYELVAGERRLRACRLAGLKKVDCIVRELSDQEAYKLSVMENMQRENLTPMEEARAFEQLQAQGMKQGEIAALVGKGRTYVTHKLKLLNIPPYLQHFLQTQELSENHIRQILRLKGLYVPKLKSDCQLGHISKEKLTLEDIPLFISQLRPEDRPPVLLFKCKETIMEAVHIFLDYAQSKEEQLYQWEVAALWWAALSVSGELTVKHLSTALDKWWERYSSAIHAVIFLSETKKPEGDSKHFDGTPKWQHLAWWGWQSDLRHSSSGKLNEKDVPWEWMKPVIERNSLSLPSSMQEWEARDNPKLQRALEIFDFHMAEQKRHDHLWGSE